MDNPDIVDAPARAPVSLGRVTNPVVLAVTEHHPV